MGDAAPRGCCGGGRLLVHCEVAVVLEVLGLCFEGEWYAGGYKCFNQFTTLLLFCDILFYIIFGLRCRFGRHRAEVRRTSCGLRFATVGAKQTSTGCPAPLYLSLSESVNTDGTI